MNRDVKEIRVDITITAMYGDLHIRLTNTHKDKVIYTVSERHHKEGWVLVPFTPSQHILEHFKETPECKGMIDILSVLTV